MTDPFLADSRVQKAIETIWAEARLLDRKDYEAWEGIFTEDGWYIVPVDPETEDFKGNLNLIYDDAHMRSLRVKRLVQGFSPSAVSAARTVRAISTFTVDAVDDEVVTIRSSQMITTFKRQETKVTGAELTHEIVLSEAGGKIQKKVVRLLDSDAAVSAAGFLV